MTSWIAPPRRTGLPSRYSTEPMQRTVMRSPSARIIGSSTSKLSPLAIAFSTQARITGRAAGV